MGLITPGYLTGLYHPDRYIMADYHPEWGYPSMLRGAPTVVETYCSESLVTANDAAPTVVSTFSSEVSII